MKEHIRSAVLGFVVGDALGVPVEFKKRGSFNVSDMLEYGTHNQPIGTWSDDTSLMIATMDSISKNGNIDYEDIMTNFEEWLNKASFTATDVVFDVGGTTFEAIKRHKFKKAIECGANAEYANGNGSLMRILPVSLYCYYKGISRNVTIDIINQSSSLTHAHEISQLSCMIYTDYIRGIIETGDKIDSYNKLRYNDYSQYSNNSIIKLSRVLNGSLINAKEDNIRSTGYVVDSLEASIWSIIHSSSYEESVLKAVNLGDDTDTVGAITGSIAGILYGENSIPSKWLDNVKKIEYLESMIDSFGKSINIREESVNKSI